MIYVNYILKVILCLLITLVSTKVFMIAANHLGEQFGIGKLVTHLLQKAGRK